MPIAPAAENATSRHPVDPQQRCGRRAGECTQRQRMRGEGGAADDDEEPDDPGDHRDLGGDDPGIDHETGEHRQARRTAPLDM